MYQYGECWEQDQSSYEPYYDEVPASAWNFELPLTTGTVVDAVESSSISSSSADSYSSYERCNTIPSSYSDLAANDVLFFHQHYPQQHHLHSKLLIGDDHEYDATDHHEKPLQISFQTNQTEKQDYVSGSSNCGYRRGPSSSSSSSTKRRIRWTKDLHEPFMTVVNRLGGPHKAKPKAILDMMKSDLLSITHIKSHLQKYRSTIWHHKASHERSFEEGDKTDVTHQLQHKIQIQIEESQQLQQEVRRSIHQQLEMQRTLQMLIEQQREQLKMMLDQQKERNKVGKKLNNP
ncbi:myb family transcription factor PHL5-like isoform X2 [Arachis stenosperma]|uniref:myb family transcription factor PHL5-like isoform X2 n=1 Tax=Arachis stenosperma TaxID=217475 RepID=UPI0025AC9F85|nr:myb family transcription factor PHL5-like isoform X2 [Arachis stenosperma]